MTQNYLSVSGALASTGVVGLSAVASVVLASFSPFSNSDLAEPRFLANFGIAEPPKKRTATTMTTIKRSGPKISPKNTAFSFDVLSPRVVRRASLREGAPPVSYSIRQDCSDVEPDQGYRSRLAQRGDHGRRLRRGGRQRDRGCDDARHSKRPLRHPDGAAAQGEGCSPGARGAHHH